MFYFEFKRQLTSLLSSCPYQPCPLSTNPCLKHHVVTWPAYNRIVHTSTNAPYLHVSLAAIISTISLGTSSHCQRCVVTNRLDTFRCGNAIWNWTVCRGMGCKMSCQLKNLHVRNYRKCGLQKKPPE